MSKSKKSKGGLVYSTNPDIKLESEDDIQDESIAPSQQNLRVMLDKKQRKGKVVTLITGFAGNEHELNELGKILKSKCGTGGSVKDGEIIIQGDFKLKIGELLSKSGYKFKYSGG
jgi:translation initiation factor 1